MGDVDTVATSFAQTYSEAREKFLTAVQARGASLDSIVHPLRGRDGETLAMDLAWLGPSDSAGLLFVTSGTHGVEGFCGSGVQVALLRDEAFAERLGRSGAAALFVHAVNPHGFSHWRRVNEDNIDVNRNCRDFSKPVVPNRGYADLHSLLVPPRWPPDVENRSALGRLVAAHGFDALKNTVTRGQCEFPDGLFFGGRAPVWSNATVRDALRRHARDRRRLAWIDIHSGLGPSGYGEKIHAGANDAVALERTRAWFGNDVTSFYDGTSTSSEVEGPICHAALAECPASEFTAIGLEFGTQSFLDVFNALRGDQWLHNRSEAPEALRIAIKRAMRDAFYTDTPAWKAMVYGQARVVAFQALNGLGG